MEGPTAPLVADMTRAVDSSNAQIAFARSAASARSIAIPADVPAARQPAERSAPVTAPVTAPVAPARIVAPAASVPRAATVRSGGLDRDTRCLAQAVFHESRGEPLRGQRAVADVVVNRARSGRWGSDVCSVVDAPSQFSGRWHWRMPQVGVPEWDRAIEIAHDALSGVVGVSARLMNFRAASMGAGGGSPMRIGRHMFW